MSSNDENLTGAKGVDVYPGVANSDPLAANFGRWNALKRLQPLTLIYGTSGYGPDSLAV